MSSKLYFRKSDVVQALRECADKARAEGFAAGRAEAERFLEFAARLNGSAPHVLKAIRGEELPPRKESPPADEDASPLDAATLAYIDALIEAKTHHADSDGGDVADVLRGWIEDPAALEAALGGEMLLKAFDEGKHPRDDGGRFVSKEAIHAAKSDPKKAEELRARVTDPEQRKKLDAAIGGETDLGRTKRGEQQQASEGRKAEAKKRFDRVRELKDAISAARRGGEEVPHTHFTELAEHLPHLTVSQLRSVRESLAASFFGRKRRDEMVTALVRHAKVRAEQMRAEQDAGDGLDFGMDAMSPAAAGGQGRAHDSDLNPWREFDKDKGYGEAQHGGRIGQRKQIMDAVSDGAKTSHGTPDTGSELKLAPEVARPMPSEAATEVMPEPMPRIAAQNTAPTYTTDKPGGATVEPAVPDLVAAMKRPDAKTRTTASGDTIKPTATRSVGSHVSGKMKRVIGYGADGSPQYSPSEPVGWVNHGQVVDAGGGDVRVYADYNKNGKDVFSYAAAEGQEDVRQAASVLAQAGYDPAEHMGDVVGHTMGTGKRSMLSRAQEYLQDVGVTPPEPAKKPAKPVESGGEKKVHGGKVQSRWEANDSIPNGGGMRFGRDLAGGGKVLGFGDDLPGEGIVTDVSVGKSGDVTYTVRPYKSAELEKRTKAVADAAEIAEATKDRVQTERWPADLHQPEWRLVGGNRTDRYGHGTNYYVGKLADGRLVAKTVHSGGDDYREVFSVPKPGSENTQEPAAPSLSYADAVAAQKAELQAKMDAAKAAKAATPAPPKKFAVGDVVTRKGGTEQGTVVGFGHTGRPAVKWHRHNGRTTHLHERDLEAVSDPSMKKAP